MSEIGFRDSHALDHEDPLAYLRERFEIPKMPDGQDTIYLCSNSLGLMPRAVVSDIQQVLADWAQRGVQGHHSGVQPWLPYHHQFASPLATLVGANASEVVVMNTLTVNLHLMMTSFYRPHDARKKILIERGAFSSDRYAVMSQIACHGLRPADVLIEVAPRPGEDTLRRDDVIDVIERQGSTLALILLPGVQYLTGQCLDIRELTRAGHRHGAKVGWDLAHAVGNVPLSLHDDGPDFAVWCHYKYLCAGPGAVAGCFVHERHAEDTRLPRLAGWWGQEERHRFEMLPSFQPTAGADGWQLSNPPILSLAPLIASLDAFGAAGMSALRRKSLALTGFLRARLETRLGDRIQIVTPSDSAEHGCQLSLRIRSTPAGRRVQEALGSAGVIGDWREPDILRLAPAPLYNRFADIDRAVTILEHVLTPNE
jgi:kynureninase